MSLHGFRKKRFCNKSDPNRNKFVRTAWLVYVVDPTNPWKCWILQCKTYGGLLLSSKAKIKLCHQCNIDMFMSTCWRATKSKSHFNIVISHNIIRMLININKSHVNITFVACWQYLSCMLVTEMCHHKNGCKIQAYAWLYLDMQDPEMEQDRIY